MSTATVPVHAHRHRPSGAAGLTVLAAGPACAVCGVPFMWPALAAMGLGASVFVAHTVSWVVVPVLVVLLARNARRHGDRRPLRVAALGAVVYLFHTVLHFVGGGADLAFVVTDNVAVVLLGTGALWDLAVTRRARRAMRIRASMVQRQDVHPGTGAVA